MTNMGFVVVADAIYWVQQLFANSKKQNGRGCITTGHFV